jgi:hypothetical protein
LTTDKLLADPRWEKLRRVLAKTEFIGVSAFGFMPDQQLPSLFRADLSAATADGPSIATADESVVKFNP